MVVFCCHMLSKCSEKQIMQRHAARPFLPTGCGPDNPKLTVACLASNSKRTLERSVRNAESILNSANEIGNVTKLVALVSNIHDAAHRGAIERLDAEVVVDASEVAILRFARGASELSDVSAESIEDAIRTVGVPPPIKAADGFALPSEWKTHADQSRALSEFFEDLWAQTRKDAEREKTTADPSEAVGLVQLGMYLKFASMATRTGDAALVSEAGARELLPRTFGFGEELVGVLSTFMDQRSVDSTWKLTERGKRAAAIRDSGADGAAVPIIALTANAVEGDREKYLREGFSGYVSKPIKRPALIAEIDKLRAQALERAIAED